MTKNQVTMASTAPNYNSVPQRFEESTPQAYDDGGSLSLSDDAMSPFKQESQMMAQPFTQGPN